MEELLQKVKDNLILSHSEDDELLRGYIRAAVSYAESYQHIPSGHYADNPMPPTTEQAVIMLSSHFYESRDGSTGGFFSDNVQAGHLPVLAVGDNFDQAFAAVEDQCLSVGVHRESSDEVINPLCPALLPGRSGDL